MENNLGKVEFLNGKNMFVLFRLGFARIVPSIGEKRYFI